MAKTSASTASAAVRAILRDALGRVKPATDELRGAEGFIAGLNRRLAAKGIKAEAMVGGSGAKGTHLKGDHDVDVFVRFDLKMYAGKGAGLSDLLAKALPGGAERIHGSRDYFQLRQGEYLFEIVPVLKVMRPEQAQNVMDVSPLHVAYVRKRTRQKPALADEIRLAKQFCKAAKVYGAESYVNGFSGHVLDLLVLEHGSLMGLLAAAAKWKDRVVLDPEKHHKDPLFALNSSKRTGPMVLVDPIQPERNAAAALSEEAFGKFKSAAKAFLKKPSPEFFIITTLNPVIINNSYNKNYAQQRTVLFVLEGRPLDGKDDVVATKLRKAHERIVEEGARHGFSLLEHGWEWDKRKRMGIGYLVFKDETLSATTQRQGPPLEMKRDCERFKAEHKGAKAKAGRLVATVPRKYRTPRQLIEGMLKNSYVKERAKRFVLK